MRFDLCDETYSLEFEILVFKVSLLCGLCHSYTDNHSDPDCFLDSLQ